MSANLDELFGVLCRYELAMDEVEEVNEWLDEGGWSRTVEKERIGRVKGRVVLLIQAGRMVF